MEENEIVEFKNFVLSVNPNNPEIWDEKELNLFLSKAGIKNSIFAFEKINGKSFINQGVVEIIKKTKGIDPKEREKLNELFVKLKDYHLTNFEKTLKLGKKKKKIKSDDQDDGN